MYYLGIRSTVNIPSEDDCVAENPVPSIGRHSL